MSSVFEDLIEEEPTPSVAPSSIFSSTILEIQAPPDSDERENDEVLSRTTMPDSTEDTELLSTVVDMSTTALPDDGDELVLLEEDSHFDDDTDEALTVASVGNEEEVEQEEDQREEPIQSSPVNGNQVRGIPYLLAKDTNPDEVGEYNYLMFKQFWLCNPEEGEAKVVVCRHCLWASKHSTCDILSNNISHTSQHLLNGCVVLSREVSRELKKLKGESQQRSTPKSNRITMAEFFEFAWEMPTAVILRKSIAATTSGAKSNPKRKNGTQLTESKNRRWRQRREEEEDSEKARRTSKPRQTLDPPKMRRSARKKVKKDDATWNFVEDGSLPIGMVYKAIKEYGKDHAREVFLMKKKRSRWARASKIVREVERIVEFGFSLDDVLGALEVFQADRSLYSVADNLQDVKKADIRKLLKQKQRTEATLSDEEDDISTFGEHHDESEFTTTTASETEGTENTSTASYGKDEDKRELRQQILKLQKTLDLREKDFAQMEREKSSAESCISQREQELKKVSEERDELLKERSELIRALSASREKAQHFEDKFQREEEKVGDLQETSDLLRRPSDPNQTIEAELNTLKSINRRLTKEKSEAQKENEELKVIQKYLEERNVKLARQWRQS